MKQREIINILNKINENKINNIVFCDDSKVLDNMNGYRNDGGVYLYCSLTFKNNVCKIEDDYEQTFGYVNTESYEISRGEGIKKLVEILTSCTNENYYICQCDKI